MHYHNEIHFVSAALTLLSLYYLSCTGLISKINSWQKFSHSKQDKYTPRNVDCKVSTLIFNSAIVLCIRYFKLTRKYFHRHHISMAGNLKKKGRFNLICCFRRGMACNFNNILYQVWIQNILKIHKSAHALPNCLQVRSEQCFPKSGNSILNLYHQNFHCVQGHLVMN
jgi:hypothetical protein